MSMPDASQFSFIAPLTCSKTHAAHIVSCVLLWLSFNFACLLQLSVTDKLALFGPFVYWSGKDLVRWVPVD